MPEPFYQIRNTKPKSAHKLNSNFTTCFLIKKKGCFFKMEVTANKHIHFMYGHCKDFNRMVATSLVMGEQKY